MSTEPAAEPIPIRIELADQPGVYEVAALPSAEEMARLSAQALENAWATIRAMAERSSALIDELTGRPDEVEVEFGVKLDIEGNAWIAKVGTEAAISISLT